MRVTVSAGDILEQRVDALVCSANVQLNLSGGVGGAILLRGGDDVQEELWSILKNQNRKWAEPGEVTCTNPGPIPVRFIVHAVAVDAFYHSDSNLIQLALKNALRKCVDRGAKTVALTALATGFGRVSFADFGNALRTVVSARWPDIDELRVVVRHPHEADEIATALKQ